MTEIHSAPPLSSPTNDTDTSTSQFQSPYTTDIIHSTIRTPGSAFNRLNSNTTYYNSLISPTYPLRTISNPTHLISPFTSPFTSSTSLLKTDSDTSALQSNESTPSILNGTSMLFKRPTPRLSSRAFTSHTVNKDKLHSPTEYNSVIDNEIVQQKELLQNQRKSPKFDLHRYGMGTSPFTHKHSNDINSPTASHHTIQQPNTANSNNNVSPMNTNTINAQIHTLNTIQNILQSNTAAPEDQTQQLQNILQNLHDNGVDLSVIRNSITAILQASINNTQQHSDKQADIQQHIETALHSVKMTTKQLTDIAALNNSIDHNNDINMDVQLSVQRQDKLSKLQASLQAASKPIDPTPAVQTATFTNVRATSTATHRSNNSTELKKELLPTTTESVPLNTSKDNVSDTEEPNEAESDADSEIDDSLVLGADGKPIGSSCHQCKTRRTDNDLYFCSITHLKKGRTKLLRTERLCRKKYCGRCLVKFYNQTPPANTGPNPLNTWSCPGCLGICSCAACKRQRTRKAEKQAKLRAKQEAKAAARASKKLKAKQTKSSEMDTSDDTVTKHKTTKTKTNGDSSNARTQPQTYTVPNAYDNQSNKMVTDNNVYMKQDPNAVSPATYNTAQQQPSQYSLLPQYVTPSAQYNMLNPSLMVPTQSPYIQQQHIPLMINQSPAQPYQPLSFLQHASPMMNIQHTQSPFMPQYTFSPHQQYSTLQDNMLLHNGLSPMLQNRSPAFNQRNIEMYNGIQSPDYNTRQLLSQPVDDNSYVVVPRHLIQQQQGNDGEYVMMQQPVQTTT